MNPGCCRHEWEDEREKKSHIPRRLDACVCAASKRGCKWRAHRAPAWAALPCELAQQSSSPEFGHPLVLICCPIGAHLGASSLLSSWSWGPCKTTSPKCVPISFPCCPFASLPSCPAHITFLHSLLILPVINSCAHKQSLHRRAISKFPLSV